MGLSCRRARSWGALGEVIVGARVVNLIINRSGRGVEWKDGKIFTGVVLLRVINVMATEGPRCFCGWLVNWLMKFSADPCRVMHIGKIKLILYAK